MNRTIAVVDDEKNIRDTVSFALAQAGYSPLVFSDGIDAWEAFRTALPDCVILDIVMPGMDGFDLCKNIRKISERTPVIFLTSRDEEIDRVLGLETGGDDYVTKPFSMRELLVRIKVIFRRLGDGTGRTTGEDELIRYGNLTLDTGCYTVAWKGNGITLTVTEFLLLKCLAESPGRVRTREQLMEQGYPVSTFVSDRTIDSHIKRIRHKFAEIDPGFDVIETVYGLGYKYGTK